MSSAHRGARTAIAAGTVRAVILDDSCRTLRRTRRRTWATCATPALLFSQGKDSIPFLESLTVGDLASLKDNTGTLSVYTNEKGGIIDDTVITKVLVGQCTGVVGRWASSGTHLAPHLAPCPRLHHHCTGVGGRAVRGGQRGVPRQGPGAHRLAPGVLEGAGRGKRRAPFVAPHDGGGSSPSIV